MNDETRRIRRGLGENHPVPSAVSNVPAAQAKPRDSEPAAAAPIAVPPAPGAEAAPTGRRGLGESASDRPSGPETPAPTSGAAASATAASTEATATAGPRPVIRWLLLAAGLLALGALVVLGARLLISIPTVQDFLATYRGEYPLPDDAPIGFPAWLSWSHFLNGLFLVLMIKTGWQVRTQRKPPASWVRDDSRWPRTKNPPRKISITLWLHLALDSLWFLNGVVFVVLLIISGQWVRVVPTSWEVIPNALSAALQYASLEWPVENGWVNYNSLQQLTYFVTIFIAAPLAAATGIRMSGTWPQSWTRLSKLYPIDVARAVHFPVMLYFVLFLLAHVTLVGATGALRNLNHMYGGQDTLNWTGAIIFAVSLVVMAGAWVAAQPIVIAPIAGLFGKVGR